MALVSLIVEDGVRPAFQDRANLSVSIILNNQVRTFSEKNLPYTLRALNGAVYATAGDLEEK